MTKLEKVVKGLECCSTVRCKGQKCPYHHEPEEWRDLDCNTELSRDALELLKEQMPRVLTLEEVIHSGNDMMWLEIKCAKPPHFMLEPTSPYTDNDERWFSVSFQSGHVQSKGLYGRQWRCWNIRPTDEQRKATPWNEPPKEDRPDANE